jgi:hypothetical protein
MNKPFAFAQHRPSGLQAELSEIRSDLLALKACITAMRLIDEMKYSADQPRWPAGDPLCGQWRPGEGGGVEVAKPPVLLASGYSFGKLIAEFETGLGRRCIDRFDFGTFVVPGPDKFLCPRIVPSSAVWHGRLLNDN